LAEEMNAIIPSGLKRKTGVYTLLIELNHESKIEVGKLGVYKFPNGIYTYTGSALGRGATDLSGRLQRHVSKTKRHFWHIDYFLSTKESQIKHIIFFETYRQEECNIVKSLISVGGEIIVRGFGASDCKSGCNSHFLFHKDNDVQRVLRIVKKAYEVITAEGKIQEIIVDEHYE
jgi:Uri superfamily endonuclease